MLKDVDFSNKALAYIIQSGNFKEKIIQDLENGNFLEAKALLRQSGIEIDLTNSFDSAARTAVQGYLDREIGLGTSNLRQVESNNFAAFLDEKGYEEATASNEREFLKSLVDDNGKGYDSDYLDTNREVLLHDTSAVAIKQNIANGSIPFVAEELPDYLSTIVNDDTRNMAFAAHLSNTENFIAYSAALKKQPTAELSEKLEDIKDVPLQTPEIEAHNHLARGVSLKTEILDDAQIVIAEEITKAGLDEAYDSILTRVPANFVIDTNTPEGVKEFVELRVGMEDAEQALQSYREFPNTLNEDNTFGPNGDAVVVQGAVGAPYSEITKTLKNNITEAQNAHLTHFQGLNTEQRQGILTHLDGLDKTAAELEASQPAEPEKSGGLLSWAGNALKRMFKDADSENGTVTTGMDSDHTTSPTIPKVAEQVLNQQLGGGG